MTTSKWNLFGGNEEEDMPSRRRESDDPFRQLQSEMNRVFEDFFNRGSQMMRGGGVSRPLRESGQQQQMSRRGGRQMGRPTGQQMMRQFNPRIDVSEDDESLKIRAEIPGMSKDDIELYCDEDSCTLKGHKEHEEEKEDEGFYHRERSSGYFQRTIPFPVGVDTDNAKAEFKDGVLNVRFPKTGESKGKQLEIE